MGFGNLGIALGAGVKTWQGLADSESKNAYYAASTRKLNADADQAEAGQVANQQLGSAVDEAVANIYGGQQPVQAMPKVNPTAVKQPSVGQASMPGQPTKAPAPVPVENNGGVSEFLCVRRE